MSRQFHKLGWIFFVVLVYSVFIMKLSNPSCHSDWIAFYSSLFRFHFLFFRNSNKSNVYYRFFFQNACRKRKYMIFMLGQKILQFGLFCSVYWILEWPLGSRISISPTMFQAREICETWTNSTSKEQLFLKLTNKTFSSISGSPIANIGNEEQLFYWRGVQSSAWILFQDVVQSIQLLLVDVFQLFHWLATDTLLSSFFHCRTLLRSSSNCVAGNVWGGLFLLSVLRNALSLNSSSRFSTFWDLNDLGRNQIGGTGSPWLLSIKGIYKINTDETLKETIPVHGEKPNTLNIITPIIASSPSRAESTIHLWVMAKDPHILLSVPKNRSSLQKQISTN